MHIYGYELCLPFQARTFKTNGIVHIIRYQVQTPPPLFLTAYIPAILHNIFYRQPLNILIMETIVAIENSHYTI